MYRGVPIIEESTEARIINSRLSEEHIPLSLQLAGNVSVPVALKGKLEYW